MEKIQSAIAKARASRANRDPGETPGRMAGGTGRTARTEAPAPSRVAAAWDALPDFEADPSRLRDNRIVTALRGPAGTEFDKLRTRMLQQMQANGWRRVAITSPGPSSGKSTISLNLGYSLSRQASLRTIICEIDLRRPALGRILGLPEKKDFSKVLEGSAPFADHAVRLRPNLAVGIANGFVQQSAELLQGPAIGQALDQIQQEYDPSVLLFDMPPFEVSDDAIAFADKVDCVLIVAAAETTSVAQIDLCEREFAGRTNVLGVVLNKCRYVGADQSYDYHA
ncbi:Mrp family chromosome partitioning ATPase [Palleronia aestuarii]|uniref:Mrp family chromosome partitioning ATPase n=1 Tax=Palleronia aestuarii TaxID=568105 RepID=A0A2W7N0N4_9RHOB|nr:CpsD/CapB family tyrosine-protein kinase [Palleronia aestuarii]PZX13511.1 Mrp family chromosome partitioning ATPase [Palleronia aestuarii]